MAEGYIQRVVDERDQLKTRTSDLLEFIASNEFWGLPELTRNLMVAQQMHMQSYLVTLSQLVHIMTTQKAP